MLYPQKLNRKKSDLIIKIMMGVSVGIAILLILINHLTNSKVHWAGLANAGIIYAWITVMYSINRNTNIAAHVLLQTIAISLLTVYIDYKTGMKEWSFNLAIPIIIIVANVTMFVLTIVSHKKYIRYSIYQLIICVLSLIPIFLMHKNLVKNVVISYVAIGVSVVNIVITICLCARDVKEEIVRKFHM